MRRLRSAASAPPLASLPPLACRRRATPAMWVPPTNGIDGRGCPRAGRLVAGRGSGAHLDGRRRRVPIAPHDRRVDRWAGRADPSRRWTMGSSSWRAVLGDPSWSVRSMLRRRVRAACRSARSAMRRPAPAAAQRRECACAPRAASTWRRRTSCASPRVMAPRACQSAGRRDARRPGRRCLGRGPAVSTRGADRRGERAQRAASSRCERSCSTSGAQRARPASRGPSRWPVSAALSGRQGAVVSPRARRDARRTRSEALGLEVTVARAVSGASRAARVAGRGRLATYWPARRHPVGGARRRLRRGRAGSPCARRGARVRRARAHRERVAGGTARRPRRPRSRHRVAGRDHVELHLRRAGPRRAAAPCGRPRARGATRRRRCGPYCSRP